MLCRIARIPSSHATKKIYGVVTRCHEYGVHLSWPAGMLILVSALGSLGDFSAVSWYSAAKGESCCDPSKPLRYPILPAIFWCLQESSSCCLFVLLGSLKHHKIASVAYMGLSTGPEWTPTWQFYTAEQRFFKTCRLCCSQFLKNRPKTSPKDGMVEWVISHDFPQFPTWCSLWPWQAQAQLVLDLAGMDGAEPQPALANQPISRCLEFSWVFPSTPSQTWTGCRIPHSQARHLSSELNHGYDTPGYVENTAQFLWN